MQYLPASFSLKWCDTVPQMFRIGKKKALIAIRKIPLKKIMQRDSIKTEYMTEANNFVRSCYGCKRTNSSETGEKSCDTKYNFKRY